MSGQDQTFWATIAQVNAAVLLALVIELGAASRRINLRLTRKGSKRLGRTVAWMMAAVAYMVGAATAFDSLAKSIQALDGVPSSKILASNELAIAAFVVVGMPLIYLLIRLTAQMIVAGKDLWREIRKLRRMNARSKRAAGRQGLNVVRRDRS